MEIIKDFDGSDSTTMFRMRNLGANIGVAKKREIHQEHESKTGTISSWTLMYLLRGG
jgi:hypothetical protein